LDVAINPDRRAAGERVTSGIRKASPKTFFAIERHLPRWSRKKSESVGLQQIQFRHVSDVILLVLEFLQLCLYIRSETDISIYIFHLLLRMTICSTREKPVFANIDLLCSAMMRRLNPDFLRLKSPLFGPESCRQQGDVSLCSFQMVSGRLDKAPGMLKFIWEYEFI